MVSERESEQTLIERIAAGDRSAVAACIELYSGLVWSLARRFLTNSSDVEEVVQEIFIELWSKAAHFDSSRSSEATFVSMVTRRRLIDRVRQLQRVPEREPLSEVDHGLSPDGHRAIEASAETQRVLEVIQNMEPTQQHILHMSAWLGMSHQAIADQINLPLGTIKSHLRRSLTKIRAQLGIVASDGTTSP